MIEIRVLGPTLILGQGGRLTAADLGGTKVPQLAQMLALDLGRPLSKEMIAERLWEGRPPASYRATIESYVCVLRRRLGLVGGRRGPLATTRHGYVLDADQVRVDVVEVRALLRAGGPAVSQALRLMFGELLADEPFAAWAVEARDALDELLVHSCTRAAHDANERGDFEQAVVLAQEATRRGFLCEPAAQELMRAAVGVGDRVQALQTYETLRRGMLDELGVEPAQATQARYLAILRDDRPVTSLESPRSSGRDEISALLQLLRRALEAEKGPVVDLPSMREVGQLLLTRTA